jgi:hypothetical protein
MNHAQKPVFAWCQLMSLSKRTRALSFQATVFVIVVEEQSLDLLWEVLKTMETLSVEERVEAEVHVSVAM